MSRRRRPARWATPVCDRRSMPPPVTRSTRCWRSTSPRHSSFALPMYGEGTFLLHPFVGQHPAVLEPDLPPGLAGDVDVVGDDHDRHLVLAVEPFEQVDQLLRGLGVDGPGRLVEEDEGGAVARRARDADA